MTATLEILDYSNDMQASVVELILSIQRYEFGLPVTAEDQPDLADIPSFYQSGAGGFWVARSNGELVGTISIRDIGNRQAALREMFVRASHRGGQHGVAKELLRTLVASATSKQLHELFLGTTERFTAAHRFYEKSGFQQIQPELLPESFPRMSLDTRFYWRELT